MCDALQDTSTTIRYPVECNCRDLRAFHNYTAPLSNVIDALRNVHHCSVFGLLLKLELELGEL